MESQRVLFLYIGGVCGVNGQLTCHYRHLFRTAGLLFHQTFKYCHKQKCFVFPCSDQAKADLKADDDGEVGEGQEAA